MQPLALYILVKDWKNFVSLLITLIIKFLL